jgi:membrane protein
MRRLLLGSLEAVIGFMTWIWISTTIVLLAAALNAEMEQYTVEDTTSGMLKSLCRRAKVVDTVAVLA